MLKDFVTVRNVYWPRPFSVFEQICLYDTFFHIIYIMWLYHSKGTGILIKLNLFTIYFFTTAGATFQKFSLISRYILFHRQWPCFHFLIISYIHIHTHIYVHTHISSRFWFVTFSYFYDNKAFSWIFFKQIFLTCRVYLGKTETRSIMKTSFSVGKTLSQG